MGEIKLDTPMTRRNFLKWGVGTAGAATVAIAAKSVVDTVTPFIEQGPNPVINPVNEGDAILLMVDGNKRQTVIHYAENPEVPVSHLYMRLESGAVKPHDFEPGKTNARNLGEMLDDAAVPLVLNTKLLPNNPEVHYVVTTDPVQTKDPPVRYLMQESDFKGLYGIKVITSYADGIQNPAKPAPFETNSRPVGAPSAKVGEGWALGYFQKDRSLKIFGFFPDAQMAKPATL
jgi:hypothetical protein